MVNLDVSERCEKLFVDPTHALQGSAATSLPLAPQFRADGLNTTGLRELLSGCHDYLNLGAPHETVSTGPVRNLLFSQSQPAEVVQEIAKIAHLPELDFVISPNRRAAACEEAMFGNIMDIIHRDISCLTALERRCTTPTPTLTDLRLFAWLLSREAEEQMVYANCRTAIGFLGYATTILGVLREQVVVKNPRSDKIPKIDAVRAEWQARISGWNMLMAGMEAGEAFVSHAEKAEPAIVPIYLHAATAFYARVIEQAFNGGYHLFAHEAFHSGTQWTGFAGILHYTRARLMDEASGLVRLYDTHIYLHNQTHHAMLDMPWVPIKKEDGSSLRAPISFFIKGSLENISKSLNLSVPSMHDLKGLEDKVSFETIFEDDEVSDHLEKLSDALVQCKNMLVSITRLGEIDERSLGTVLRWGQEFPDFVAQVVSDLKMKKRTVPESFKVIFPAIFDHLIRFCGTAENLHSPSFSENLRNNKARMTKALSSH